MKAPRIQYARSGDVSIAYSVIGDGPYDVVFVGGWFLSTLACAWEGPAADTLTRLASFCRLIVFDKRGTGLSDRDTGIPDLETRMDDIRAVMDAAGSKRAAIVGVSEGGPMTLLFTATYPERTAAAILYGTGASYLQQNDYPWGSTAAEWDAAVASNTPAIGSDAWDLRALRSLSPSLSDDPEAVQWWHRWLRTSASPSAVRALSRMNRDIDVRSVLPTITVPTLVVHPAGDQVFAVDEGRYIASHVPGAGFVELPGSDHGWWVRADELGSEVQRFLDNLWQRGEWEAIEHDRVLATVLFTDIVGSTERAAALGDRQWKELLQRHHAVVRRQLSRYAGREIDTAGDGFFAAFDGPARGIRCACAIMRAVNELGLEMRAGLHTGECEVVDGKVGGIAVHIGARVAAEAEPGEVLASGTVHDLVAGSGIEFAERGETALKGVNGTLRLYSIASPTAVA